MEYSVHAWVPFSLNAESRCWSTDLEMTAVSVYSLQTVCGADATSEHAERLHH
jgi:hypothetical protein